MANVRPTPTGAGFVGLASEAIASVNAWIAAQTAGQVHEAEDDEVSDIGSVDLGTTSDGFGDFGDD